MQAVILIPCTDRKRIQPDPYLRARSLPPGSFENLATEWGRRISFSDVVKTPGALYCGRAYREAHLASDRISAELSVISAGHGLVRQKQKIAPYGLTVAAGKKDSIGSKVEASSWSASSWWRALGRHTAAQTDLSKFVRETTADLILLSLSENYAGMLKDSLEGLTDLERRKFRVFGAGIAEHLPSSLVESVMPYDRRLNGPESPINGTMSDFASRAIHHYTRCLAGGVIRGENAEEDRHELEELMRTWSAPKVPVRQRMSDDEVLSFILAKWEKTDGRSGASLRFLRDSGHACEQGRFKDLFNQARHMRESTA